MSFYRLLRNLFRVIFVHQVNELNGELQLRWKRAKDAFKSAAIHSFNLKNQKRKI